MRFSGTVVVYSAFGIFIKFCCSCFHEWSKPRHFPKKTFAYLIVTACAMFPLVEKSDQCRCNAVRAFFVYLCETLLVFYRLTKSTVLRMTIAHHMISHCGAPCMPSVRLSVVLNSRARLITVATFCTNFVNRY